MDEKIVTSEKAGQTVSRRTVAKGIAWGVPAITMLGATPAFAATGDVIGITSVTVFPSATGILTAPFVAALTINKNTPPTATVTVVGTATPGVQVQVTAGGYPSPPTTATGGEWTIVIPAATVAAWADGNYDVSATVVSGGKPSVTSDQPVRKDTVAPTVDATQATISTNNQKVTIKGSMSEAGSVVVTTTPSLEPFNYSYPSPGTWEAVSNAGKNNGYRGTVVATDRAGNVGTSDSFSWPDKATSPVTL